MADDSGDTSWEARFLDYLGLGLILTGTDILVREAAITFAAILYVVGGTLLAAGLSWSRIRPRLSVGLSRSISQVANDFRYWLVVLAVLVVCARIPPLFYRLPPNASPSSVPTAPRASDEQMIASIRAQLTETQTQRDQAIQERDAANQRLTVIRAPPPMPNPLHSDAVKWKIASQLRDFMKHENQMCEAVIVRLQLPYAERYAEDLKEILDAADWKYSEKFATATLRPGLSLLSSSSGVPHSCSEYLRATMNGAAGSPIPVSQDWIKENKPTENMRDKCSGECVEIGIGNPPE